MGATLVDIREKIVVLLIMVNIRNYPDVVVYETFSRQT